MIPLLLALFALLFSIQSSFAQPDSLWSRSYGGYGFDFCNSVQQTTDGGYVLAGASSSFGAGSQDFWLVKTDADGESLWTRTFGGSDSDVCHSVQQTSDGGYILAGDSYTFGNGLADVWLVKTGANGDSLWSRTFGGGNVDVCHSVQQTTDSGYVLAGHSLSFGNGSWDFWLAKTNVNGDSLWTRTFGGDLDDVGRSAVEATDDGYVIVGRRESSGSGLPDFWLVKTDANGDSLWSRTFGGSDWDECYCVLQTANGGYVLAGVTKSFGVGEEDFWLLKTNANGDSLWSHTYGGLGSEHCYSVQQTTDGGFVLAGATNSFGVGDYDLWLVRTDSNGDSLWSRTFGQRSLDNCMSVKLLTDGGYILAGYTDNGAPDFDFWLVKTGLDPTIDIDEHFDPQPSTYSLSAFPNPFNSELTLNVSGFTGKVHISLFDLLGREVTAIHDGLLTSDQLHYTAPASLASGIYFVQANNTANSLSTKIIYLK
ncbi:T9SS type A sorting domain-containing protein [bacterium]|nr:T9SS type A sorting domain-containing protein [bacterium]